ncbi:hypothetical protein COCNU_07G004290 [Cocos nucifera]|uniref:PIG-P domain-containing protein n=1 Tax=Cocos nucifera TaxID=13894 RepID=A0A8K0IF33_COCNU|nr:hypothetical protein COCNU_07G004290 [Cocos nucifera]
MFDPVEKVPGFAEGRGPKPSEVYGFVDAITTVIAAVIFLVWAYTPEPWLHYLGITYYPSNHIHEKKIDLRLGSSYPGLLSLWGHFYMKWQSEGIICLDVFDSLSKSKFRCQAQLIQLFFFYFTDDHLKQTHSVSL